MPLDQCTNAPMYQWIKPPIRQLTTTASSNLTTFSFVNGSASGARSHGQAAPCFSPFSVLFPFPWNTHGSESIGSLFATVHAFWIAPFQLCSPPLPRLGVGVYGSIVRLIRFSFRFSSVKERATTICLPLTQLTYTRGKLRAASLAKLLCCRGRFSSRRSEMMKVLLFFIPVQKHRWNGNCWTGIEAVCFFHLVF
jgi:hypothetical protein